MNQSVTFEEAYKVFHGDKKGVHGILEFIIRDRRGNVVQHYFDRNIIKIFAKEMLAHRLPSTQIWDPNANTGTGAWVDSGIDPTEEFSARYILFGASFSSTGAPLDNEDPRFYTKDTVTDTYIPIRLGPGAEYEGSLINAIPLAEPNRSLKKVEDISYQASFQPAGTPLLQSDVRGINNILKLKTTLRLDEYNGFGLTDSDYFTITEVALAGGKKFSTVGACECTPRTLFLEGGSGSGGPLHCSANGTSTVTIDTGESDVDLIKAGDQIKIVGASDSVGSESINQVNPFYLVLTKAVGGRDLGLDRTPVDVNNVPLTGSIGVYRDTLRIFSHRILSVPLKKSSDFEIDCIWRIIFA